MGRHHSPRPERVDLLDHVNKTARDQRTQNADHEREFIGRKKETMLLGGMRA
jgi:hypothetical protein